MSGFGFNARKEEREPSELERELKVSFDEKLTESTLLNRGEEFMEIFINGRGYMGVYRGTTKEGNHVLMPSILPRGSPYIDGSGSQHDKYIWMNCPNFYKGSIDGFRPVLRSVLDAAAYGFSKVEGENKCISDQDSQQDERI
jgi:hypothetical protein